MPAAFSCLSPSCFYRWSGFFLVNQTGFSYNRNNEMKFSRLTEKTEQSERRDVMNCRTAEGMVNGYINHELSLKELEEFLDHIQTCSSCYDELETYFIVHEAMQQLDDNDSGSVMDFKSLLEQDIRKSRRYIRKKKIGRFSVGVLLCILIVALAAFMVYVVMQMIRII